MKRFINIATAAALTASVICVPTAIVAYAAETASFEVCMTDQLLAPGKKEVTIPVSFDEDITFSSINMNMVAEYTSPSAYTTSITSVKSALPDTEGVSVAFENNSDIKVSSTKDYTLKKGTVLFNVTVQIGNMLKNPDGTEKWPIGAIIRVSTKGFSMMKADKTETTLSDRALVKANAIVQVIPTEKTDGLSVKVGSVSSPTNIVKVPVTLNGTMMSFVTEYKVDNKAEIISIDKTNWDLQMKDEGKYSKFLWVNDVIKDVTFENAEVAVLTVKLPDNAKESDKFNISVRSVDIASGDKDNSTFYPSTITNGVITYTPSAAKGSVMSDVKVASPYIVSKTKELNLNDLKLTATITDKDGVKSTIEITNPADCFEIAEAETGTVERTLKLKYTGGVYTCSEPVTLTYLRTLLGDINLDGKVDTRDSAYAIKQYSAAMLSKDFLTGLIQGTASLNTLVEKYSIDTIRALSAASGDPDQNGKIDARDATYIIKYYSASSFGNASWDKILNKQ